jgi:hypothetical protein
VLFSDALCDEQTLQQTFYNSQWPLRSFCHQDIQVKHHGKAILFNEACKPQITADDFKPSGGSNCAELVVRRVNGAPTSPVVNMTGRSFCELEVCQRRKLSYMGRQADC